MKEVKAIIQPFMLEHVLDALSALDDLPGVTISQILGWGKSRSVDAEHPVYEAGHAVAAKTKVEIVVPDEWAERVVEAIAQAARTGKPGDGKVFVYDVAEAVKIRTGDRGEPAL